MRPLANAISLFMFSLLLFGLHRFLSFSYLSEGINLALHAKSELIGVGFMSDIWIAYLLAFMLWLVQLGCKGSQRPYWLLGGTMICLTALHQGYVEYFRYQIQPFHLWYFLDWDFIRANIKTAGSPNSLIILGCGTLSLWAFHRVPLSRLSQKQLALTFLGLFCLSLFSHNRNIHYRVQWFVPQALQVNGLEHLYLSAAKRRIPSALSAAELAKLSAADGTAKSLYEALFQLPDETDQGELWDALKESFEKTSDAEIIVILMESQRPSESGLYGSNSTFSPTLDHLARKGIYFSNAFATGGVTRTAQEAILCGLRSGQETSLMRGRSDVHLPCLSDFSESEIRWVHGGEARFDSQVSFWQDHNITDITAKGDFNPNSPATDWGVSDRVLFRQAQRLLKEPSLVTFLLTVTNHIPWTLPADTPVEVSGRQFRHSSHATTLYADLALKEFVQGLKRSGTWGKSLVLLLSDHGNHEPSLHDLYKDKRQQSAFRQSHIHFILTGGITESLYLKYPQLPHRLDHQVSQADAAAIIALLTQTPLPVLADLPFSLERRTPVYADLGYGVFVPAADVVLDNEALLEGNYPEGSASQSALFHRAYLNGLNLWNVNPPVIRQSFPNPSRGKSSLEAVAAPPRSKHHD